VRDNTSIEVDVRLGNCCDIIELHTEKKSEAKEPDETILNRDGDKKLGHIGSVSRLTSCRSIEELGEQPPFPRPPVFATFFAPSAAKALEGRKATKVRKASTGRPVRPPALPTASTGKAIS
jgi:hypothetical protein